MNLVVKSRGMDITQALHEDVQAKLKKTTSSFSFTVVSTKVVLAYQKAAMKALRHKVTVSVQIKGEPIVVEMNGEDMYAVITDVMLKLRRQLVAYSEVQLASSRTSTADLKRLHGLMLEPITTV